MSPLLNSSCSNSEGTSKDSAIDLTLPSRSATPESCLPTSPLNVANAEAMTPLERVKAQLKAARALPLMPLAMKSDKSEPISARPTGIKLLLRQTAPPVASTSTLARSPKSERTNSMSPSKYPRRIASPVTFPQLSEPSHARLGPPPPPVVGSSSRSSTPHTESDSDIEVLHALRQPSVVDKTKKDKGKGKTTSPSSRSKSKTPERLARVDRSGSLVLSPQKPIPKGAIRERQYHLPPISPDFGSAPLFQLGPSGVSKDQERGEVKAINKALPDSLLSPLVIIPPPPVVASPPLKVVKRTTPQHVDDGKDSPNKRARYGGPAYIPRRPSKRRKGSIDVGQNNEEVT